MNLAQVSKITQVGAGLTHIFPGTFLKMSTPGQSYTAPYLFFQTKFLRNQQATRIDPTKALLASIGETLHQRRVSYTRIHRDRDACVTQWKGD